MRAIDKAARPNITIAVIIKPNGDRSQATTIGSISVIMFFIYYTPIKLHNQYNYVNKNIRSSSQFTPDKKEKAVITLSNGFSFEFVTGSGSLKYGLGWAHERLLIRLGLINPRLFANVMKTPTIPPRKGNYVWWHPWTCIRPIFEGGKLVGIVNSVGLTNPGPDWVAEHVGPKLDSKKVPVIASVHGEETAGIRIANRIFNDIDVVAVELNAWCPNTGNQISDSDTVIRQAEAVKEESAHPVLVKLSPVHDFLYIVPRLVGIAEAIDINSVPWPIVFPNRKSPLQGFFGCGMPGAVSGKKAQPHTWACAREIKRMGLIPVICPSMWSLEDVVQMLDSEKFPAVSFASRHIPFAWLPTRYVRQYQALHWKVAE